MIAIDQVRAVEYHRNGVSGVGFTIVDFLWSDEDHTAMETRAVVFEPEDGERPTHYAILSADPTQRWRGDYFIDVLWPILRQRQEDCEVAHA